MKVVSDFMLTQMSANASINKSGEKAVAAMVKEYRQIDKGPMEGSPVTPPVDPNALYYKERRKALEAVNLVKEKINRIIKGMTCADASKKNRY